MSDVPAGEMRRSLTLTGITVNAMALIAPGAFLWTTFQLQAAQKGGTTATDMWTGLVFALVLALLTAYSYSELARIYPDAGTGSSYYFAEAALLDREGPRMRKFARTAKLTVGWISHLYYWLYPAIMVGFMGILFGYLYSAIFHHTLTYIPQAAGCVALALACGYIAFRGISGSTMTAIIINVVQITCLVAVSFLFIAYRLGHGHEVYAFANAGKVVIPHSFIHIIYQSTIAILLLVGFESVTALGAEALRPEKDIKKGVLLSLIIQGGICYLFEYFAANFAVSTATTHNPAIVLPAGTDPLGGFASAAVDPAPIGTMAKNIAASTLHAGTSVSLLVAATVLVALVGTTLASLNTGVRVTYAMAKDKEMPGILGLLHGRFATPHGGILVLTLISAAIGVYCATPYNVDNITQITLASNTGTFLVYGMTCVVAVVAFAQRHDKHVLKHLVVPGLGALMNVAELAGIVYLAITAGGASSKDAYKALGLVAVWIVLGVVWVAANPNKDHARKVHEDRTSRTPPSPAAV
ncbi:MAG: basic amino acid/polyamine antiporter, family [Acidimicrobiaceae bacterium]|nr:basic amino acid/polyamine antiporter, family [Acidimicrobiaceae bacterium]